MEDKKSDELFKKLSKIQELPDNYAYLLVKKEFSNILSDYFKNDDIFSDIKNSSQFVVALTQVCQELSLTLEERVHCNTLIYDTLPNINSSYMKKLYLFLGSIVNQNIVNSLITNCGLTKVLATFLAITRKSSLNDHINITKLNFTIMSTSPNIMTVQTIIDIYSVLFEYKYNIKDLFLLLSKETFVYTSKDSWITSSIISVSNNISIACLSLVDSLDISYIEEIMLEYYESLESIDFDDKQIRFKFNSINSNYKNSFPNIYKVINKLKSNNIIIP